MTAVWTSSGSSGDNEGGTSEDAKTTSYDDEVRTLFDTTVSVDVTGLPKWLNVDREVVSSDNALNSTYHHEFILTRTPTVSTFDVKRLWCNLRGSIERIFDVFCGQDHNVDHIKLRQKQ